MSHAGAGEETITAERLIAEQGEEAYLQAVAESADKLKWQLEQAALRKLLGRGEVGRQVFSLREVEVRDGGVVLLGRLIQPQSPEGVSAATIIYAEDLKEIIPEVAYTLDQEE